MFPFTLLYNLPMTNKIYSMSKWLMLLSVYFSITCTSSSLLARDRIDIVGSSTLYPFSRMVADTSHKKKKLPQPRVLATGSGRGFQLFCDSNDITTPDITNASRRMNLEEFEKCTKKEINITEIKVGYDGIALANVTQAPKFELTSTAIFLAIAKDIPEIAADGKFTGKLIPNTYKTWNEIYPNLPDQPIEILGPTVSSGTYGAFLELAMEGGCQNIPWIKRLYKDSLAEKKQGNLKKYNKLKKRYNSICHSIREDNVFISGDDDEEENLSMLEDNQHLLGIFSFAFLQKNSYMLQGSSIDGREINVNTIADGSYPLARPLYMYIKHAHVNKVIGVKEYIAEFTSEKAWGDGGYLAERGMIPMPHSERKKNARKASKMTLFVMP